MAWSSMIFDFWIETAYKIHATRKKHMWFVQTFICSYLNERSESKSQDEMKCVVRVKEVIWGYEMGKMHLPEWLSYVWNIWKKIKKNKDF